MTEIISLVEDDPEGGYLARAIGESIFTQADNIQELRELVRDAVRCHYPDESALPKLIHLQHDRATNNPDEQVREFARQKLAELEERK